MRRTLKNDRTWNCNRHIEENNVQLASPPSPKWFSSTGKLLKKISPTNWQLNPATKCDCSRALATPHPSLTISWQHTIQNSHIEPRQTAKHRRKPESNVAGRWQNKTSVHEFCYGSSRFYRRVFLTSTLHDLYARLRVPLSPRRSPPPSSTAFLAYVVMCDNWQSLVPLTASKAAKETRRTLLLWTYWHNVTWK